MCRGLIAVESLQLGPSSWGQGHALPQPPSSNSNDSVGLLQRSVLLEPIQDRCLWGRGVQAWAGWVDHVCACLCVYPSSMLQCGWEQKGAGELAPSHHGVLLHNSKEAKNSEFEPGLAGPHEGVGVKVRGWNIFYLVIYELVA